MIIKSLKSKLFLKIVILMMLLFLGASSVSAVEGSITKTLRYGMKDTQVKYLQQFLNEKGYIVSRMGAGSVGLETTYFGQATDTAVKAYQRAKGLVADGIFGTKSRASFFVPNQEINASTGTLNSSMTKASDNSYISTTIGNQGKATYQFLVNQAGTYAVSAYARAIDGNHDSFYLGMDSDVVLNDYHTSDLFQNASFSWHNLSMRGTGTYSANQFNPMTWYLTPGTHVLTLSGREAGTDLGKLKLIPFSTPTNQNPTVSLTSPTNSTTYTAPATITLSANASDSDGTITKVEFYNGNTLIFSDPSSPYTFTWSSVPAGSYSLTAKGYDNSGAVTRSEERRVGKE